LTLGSTLLDPFHHAAKYGCELPLSPGGAREGGGREWGKTPENLDAASTTGTTSTKATTSLIGTHHLKPKPNKAKAFVELRHPTDPAAPSSQVSSDALR
jgi:hypothetical protein